MGAWLSSLQQFQGGLFVLSMVSDPLACIALVHFGPVAALFFMLSFLSLSHALSLSLSLFLALFPTPSPPLPLHSFIYLPLFCPFHFA